MDKPPASFETDMNNRPSRRRHQKQRFWQILLPVGLGSGLILAAVVLVILTATRGAPGANISGWADTSFIWLILPVLLIAVVIAVLVFGLIYLVARILKVLPSYTHLAQHYAALAATQVKFWSDKLVAPFIKVGSTRARINKFFSGLLGRAKG